MAEPALGIVEVSSIARGVVVADTMAKKAPIRILSSRPISPGKHIVVVAGDVAEVDEAMRAGVAAAGATLVDRLFLPQAHESLASLLRGASNPQPIDSAAIFETHTICAAVLAADAAAKAAEVIVVELRLGQGIGGKGVFMLSGRLDAVEAAVAAGREVVEAALVVAVEVIAAPHDDLRSRLVW